MPPEKSSGPKTSGPSRKCDHMASQNLKTVIVTGVSQGLGLAIARRVAADPAYRLVGLSRKLTPAYEALIAEHGDKVEFHAFDVSGIGAIPAFVRDTVDRHGPIWGLVNNAGIGKDGVLATQHITDIEYMMTVNLTSAIVFAKYASRSMLSARAGRIVSISSIIASTGFNGLAAYAATKAGLEGFTRSLSRELGKRGITVNCVAPGYMVTEMSLGIPSDKMDSIKRRAPLGLPDPEDAAGAVLYLLGPDGGKVSGTVITVDGGSTA